MLRRAFTIAAFLVVSMSFSLRPANAQSHMGQNIGQHVVLVDAPFLARGGCQTVSFQDRSFFRVFPDGSRSQQPFQVPPRRRLVVTDVEWKAYGGVNGTVALQPGRTLRLRIFLTTNTVGGDAVFQSTPVTLDLNSAQGRPGASEQLTTGFVVAPDTPICPTAEQMRPNSIATAHIDTLVLRGYLIKAGGKQPRQD